MRKLLITSLLFSFIPLFGKKITLSTIDYTQNIGQWTTPVLYKADLHGGWAFLEKNAITFKFLEHAHKHPSKNEQPEKIKGHAYKINWLNANSNPKVDGMDKQSYYNNYFIGKDENKWKSNVGNYRTIFYHDVYSNIDFKIYSDASTMKSDYIVRKNGNPTDIKFQYQGLDKISIEKNGNLKLTTSINTIYELRPYAYQTIQGREKEVACEYKLVGNVLTFRLPQGYDKNYDLIIDPTLIFSTYSGSYSDNWGSSATHDNDGNMFLGGVAFGNKYPTTLGAFQTDFAGGSWYEPTDVVITKFNATGTTRLYSTYLGGSDNEILSSLLCTPKNELIAVMTTSSTDFPVTSNAYDKTFNGGDFALAYDILLPNGTDLAITKLNTNGTALIGSTYYGGKGNDGVNLSNLTAYNYGDESRSDVAIDKDGNIYITSTTNSSDLPGTSGKAQPNFGGGESDGLIAKFNFNLSNLQWASYFGGSKTDASYSMGLDKNENIFICGGTSSNNLPSKQNGLNPNYKGGETDGFITKINNNGTTILATSYLGTDDYDQAFILDLDINDNVVIFGQTLGAYPRSNGVYFNSGSSQFIHKINNTLNTSIFSTVFGSKNSTSINIVPTALMVDVCGNIYAVGWGGAVNHEGNTFDMAITPDAYKKTTDGSDFYLFNLNASATTLKYATYFGEDGGIGDHVDGGTSRFDKNGIVYQAVCASCAQTNSFPTTPGVVGPDNNSNNCNMAGFKFKFDLTALQLIQTTATPSNGCVPLKVDFAYKASVPGTSWYWDFGDGSTSTSALPTHTYTSAGNYTVRFIINDADNCNPADSTSFTISAGERKTSILDTVICHGNVLVIANQSFSETGTYEVTLPTTQGCDSIITLHLTIIDSVVVHLDQTICSGGSFSIGNNTFNKTGNYTVLLDAVSGCDSIIHLNLTVEDTLRQKLYKEICKGQQFNIGDYIFYRTGDYSVYLKTAIGCDSLVQLSLNVLDTLKENVNSKICEGDSITIGTQVIYDAGEYDIYFSSVGGCDSMVHLSLTVLQHQYSRLSEAICQGATFQVGNQIFSKAGEYIVHLPTESGCDSIVYFTLSTHALPIIDAVADKSIALADEPIQLNVITTESLTYNWVPANFVSNAFIQNPTTTISAPTWFIVSVRDKETKCTATDSVFVDLGYLYCTKDHIFIPNAFSPNGDGINDLFLIRSTILKSMHLEILDRWGNKVFESDDINKGWDGLYKGQPATIDSYGYYFIGECKQEQNNKIVIKGNVSLLR
jgi:gliding motility-associated-like protein